MKKLLTKLIFASLALTISGCVNGQSSEQSQTSESSSSSQIVESSSSSIFLSSSEVSSKSSSKSSSSSSLDYVPDQLSTASGLKVYFKAQGARIDKITWGSDNKQIAKDGFVVGRCANRIANAKFTLNGQTYNLDKNSGQNSLHGGSSNWQGPFANANWKKESQTASTITYSLHSNDRANGYPGNLDVTVKYTLSQEGELAIEYSAKSDKDTIFNPTNHLFIAVNGGSDRNYPNIKLQIDADNYTPLNNDQIPTGVVASVEGTQFDYRTEKSFDGSKKYDDNYVLNGTGYRHAASLTGESSRIKIDVFTDRAGMQLYKDGNGSICLETQMFPDMINQPNFAEYGTTILKANEQFYSKTAYIFSSIN